MVVDRDVLCSLLQLREFGFGSPQRLLRTIDSSAVFNSLLHLLADRSHALPTTGFTQEVLLQTTSFVFCLPENRDTDRVGNPRGILCSYFSGARAKDENLRERI